MAKVNILEGISAMLKKLSNLVLLLLYACTSTSLLAGSVYVQEDGSFITSNGKPALNAGTLSFYGYDEIIEDYLYDEGGENPSHESNYRVIFKKKNIPVLLLEVEDKYIYRANILTNDIPYVNKFGETIIVGMKIRKLLTSLREYEFLQGHESGTYISSKLHKNVSFYTDCEINLKNKSNFNSCVLNKILIFDFKPDISWSKKR